MRGKAPFPKGSARLRHAPPSLEPKGRETRRDEKAEAARPKVEELFNTEGARSPSMRDQVRRRLGVGLYETAQALFVYSKMSALYSLFKTRFSHITISFALFKKLRPWYIRRKKEEGCLCKHCENFKGYQTALHSLVALFEPVVDSNAAVDADDADDNDEDELEAQSWDGLPKLLKLLELCALQSKSDMVKFCLCRGAFDGAGKVNCINGTCPRCGFNKLWSGEGGLRRHVIDGRAWIVRKSTSSKISLSPNKMA